ncbi:MAG: hypothetical protein U0Y10_26490 [Spirosomataceae bacterium]
MKTLISWVVLCLVAYDGFSQNQLVRSRIEISYSYRITTTERKEGLQHITTIQNTHQLNGACESEWIDSDFQIDLDKTGGILQGNGKASLKEDRTETNECETKLSNYQAETQLDLAATKFSFLYSKTPQTENSSFQFFPLWKSPSGAGQDVTTCTGKCQSCQGNTYTLPREVIEGLAVAAGMADNYMIQKGDAINTLLAAGGDAIRLMTGSIVKTGRSFQISQQVSFTEHPSPNKTVEHQRSVSISIRPDDAPLFEAWIEPVTRLTNYEQFVPLGPAIAQGTITPSQSLAANGNTYGNSVVFEIKVINKKANVPYNSKHQVTWSLVDVSRYPGWCNNFPPKGQEDTKPDLQFIPELNSNFQQLTEDRAVSNMTLSPHFIVVTSFDYAAWGKLQAEVKLEDGTMLTAKYKPTDRAAVLIPKDDDENKIADYWEQQIGVTGKDATWDEDPFPKNQRRDGDGYTLFEEYRGFKALNHTLKNATNIQQTYQHFRSDPQHKDIFIYDEDGLFTSYYAQHNPASLNWHLIAPNQMVFTRQGLDPENRWVNFHTTSYHYAKQYAMHLVKRSIAPAGGGIVGQAFSNPEIKTYDENEAANAVMGGYLLSTEQNGQPIRTSACPPDEGFNKPLKCFYIVELYQGTIERLCNQLKPSVRQAVFQKMMFSTVIHEVGHGLGITHHRKGGVEDGAETVRGVLDCAMRYTSDLENQRPGSLYRWQLRYCQHGETFQEVVDSSASTTNPNAPPQAIQWVTFPAHDCFKQIDVKSDL